jgi:DNA-binding transcriptional MerR regulator
MTVTISEAARRTNLTPKAIRLYEARGLLTVARSPSGYRTYTGDDLRLLRFVAQARTIGLGLPAIHQLVELRQNGVPPSSEVLAILGNHLQALDRKLTDLSAQRSGLSEVFEALRSAARDGHDPRLCRILDTTPARTGRRHGAA